MPLRSVLSDDGSQLVIGVEDVLDSSLMDEFRKAYIDFIYKDMTYVIDFGQIEYIDISGLGMLLTMRALLGDQVSISIVNCCPEVTKLLTYFRFDLKFDLHSAPA